MLLSLCTYWIHFHAKNTHTQCFKTNHCPIVKVGDESYENWSLITRDGCFTRDGKAPISNWEPCHENHCHAKRIFNFFIKGQEGLDSLEAFSMIFIRNDGIRYVENLKS